MDKSLKYVILFAVTVVLQVFFFDRLTLGVWFAPIIYTSLLILLPLDTPSAGALFAGLLTGAVMDLATGMAGLNTIATLAAAYARRPLIEVFGGRDVLRESAVPSSKSMGRRQFANYLIAMVSLHSALYYTFEILTLANFGRSLLRFAAGTVSSLAMLWIVSRIFTSKVNVRTL